MLQLTALPTPGLIDLPRPSAMAATSMTSDFALALATIAAPAPEIGVQLGEPAALPGSLTETAPTPAAATRQSSAARGKIMPVDIAAPAPPSSPSVDLFTPLADAEILEDTLARGKTPSPKRARGKAVEQLRSSLLPKRGAVTVPDIGQAPAPERKRDAIEPTTIVAPINIAWPTTSASSLDMPFPAMLPDAPSVDATDAPRTRTIAEREATPLSLDAIAASPPSQVASVEGRSTTLAPAERPVASATMESESADIPASRDPAVPMTVTAQPDPAPLADALRRAVQHFETSLPAIATTDTAQRLVARAALVPVEALAPARLPSLVPASATVHSAMSQPRSDASPEPQADVGPIVATPREIPSVTARVVDVPTIPRPADPAPQSALPALVRQPAAEVFAAARFAADRPVTRAVRSLDDLSAPLLAGLAGSAPVPIAVQGVAAANQPPLDTTRQDWPATMIERIEVLRDTAETNMRETRIRLVPDALGPVDVSIRQDGDTTSVRLTAETPQARAMLAEAAPRLTELADARGLKLAQAGVEGGASGFAGRHAQQQQDQPARPAPARAAAEAAREDGTESDRIA